MNKFRIAVATLAIAGFASMAFADNAKKKTKGEKPKASPGWVIIEEDWSYPFLHEFSTALHSEAYDIYDGYAPYGYWDDTIVFERSKLESNLITVKTELEKLATKLGASR